MLKTIGFLAIVTGLAIPVSLPGVLTEAHLAEPAKVGNLLATLADPAGMAGDGFGSQVAISGNTAIVGAPTGTRGGAAYVYVKASSGWGSSPSVTLDNPTGQRYFGFSVATSGDFTLVSDPFANSGSGAVFVYEKGPYLWKTGVIKTLTEPGNPAGAQFGDRIAMFGGTALISGTQGSTNAVYVYQLSSEGWSNEPVATFVDPAPTFNDGFGYSLSLSPDWAVVGASGTNSYEGSVYIYTKRSNRWQVKPEIQLNDPAANKDDYFGDSVSLSERTLLVGARGKNPVSGGEAYIYTMGPSGWPLLPSVSLVDPVSGSNFFGSSVGLSDGVAVVGASGTGANTGAAYIYMQGPTGWPTAPSASLPVSGTFAGTIGASEKSAVIGSPGSGKTYIFRL